MKEDIQKKVEESDNLVKDITKKLQEDISKIKNDTTLTEE